MDQPDIRVRLGVRPIINVSGTMTALGSSIVVPEAIEAVAAVLGQFVEVDDLQRRASRVIARLCRAEAGFVTASCAGALTICVAAAMTGADLLAIERLPDAGGLKNEVIIQAGHMVAYGAPVEQGIRLAGARVVMVGQATATRAYQLAGAVTANTAAAMYVVSHHTVQHGMIGLPAFVAAMHDRGVPVIVDAASEYDLRGFLDAGADLVCYSSHKFLGGPTGGIVAGGKDLVRAAYLQNRGIGRGMKVGKEGIAGTIAALEAWERRDHAAVRERETTALHRWREVLDGRPGVTTVVLPDPTDNPLDRLQVWLDPQGAHITAWDLADRLGSGALPVIVRDHEIELGFFLMDPCNLHPGEAELVAGRLREELDRAQASNTTIATPIAGRGLARTQALLSWPD